MARPLLPLLRYVDASKYWRWWEGLKMKVLATFLWVDHGADAETSVIV